MLRPRKSLLLLTSIAILWILLVLFRAIASSIDYQRVEHGDSPIFSIPWMYATDGGTIIYRGLGYDLTALQRFHVEDERGPLGYDCGPILEYWGNWLLLPLADKQTITFVPRPAPSTSPR